MKKKLLVIVLALVIVFSLTALGRTENSSRNSTPGSVGNSGKREVFPAFEGKDLNGNAVDSRSLFSGNKVTVVNFWFSSCPPCVNELSDLNALNEKLKEQGGSVIGINVDTLDGNQAMISLANRILEQKGAVYQNIWFDRSSEAGKFAGKVVAFPTTYVVDSEGRIVGQPVMGGINNRRIMELLQDQIDLALGKGDL